MQKPLETSQRPTRRFPSSTAKLQTTGGMMATVSLNRSMLAYCALSCGFSVLSSTFFFYYVKVFLNHYHIDEGWFHVAQSLFMVWNAVNDPLFAYLQDKRQWTITRTRRASVLYSAPLMALSYIMAWFPWSREGHWMTGLHLITTLCFYDTMFTFCGLAACCLFTEISSDQEVRLRLTRYSQIAHLLGSSSVFLCEFTSNSLQNFPAFQFTTVVIATIAWLLMYFTGLNAYTEYDRQQMGRAEQEKAGDSDEKVVSASYWKLTWQILSDKNFLAFVSVNFCQEFHRAFLGQFTNILCDELVSEDDVPRFVRKLFYGFFSTFASLLVIVGTPMIAKIGYTKVIRGNFLWKIGAGLLLMMLGPGHPWILMVFLLLDSGFASATFSLFNMPLANIADSNKEKYNYKHPISSMVFGTNALVVKPALSLSPMLVVAILNRYGYEQLKKHLLPPGEAEHLHSAMFYLICCYPMVLGVIQLAAWSFYRLHPKRAVELTLTASSEL